MGDNEVRVQVVVFRFSTRIVRMVQDLTKLVTCKLGTGPPGTGHGFVISNVGEK